MSTQNIGLSTSTSNNGTLLQITGLASGLDTNAIINSLLAIDKQPITRLTNQQKGLQALNTQLTGIQTSIQKVVMNAQKLGDVGLFASSQTVSSSDPTRVTASTVSGAGVGGYQVNVTQLANSAQRTFTYQSPGADTSITIDSGLPTQYTTTIKAGASIQDFVNAINGDSNAPVYAAATDSQTVVLSYRQTGDHSSSSYLTVGGGVLTNPTASRPGQDAKYSIDGGVEQTSSSNTVANAIGGVTLTFNGITTVSGPVTVNVGAPAPNSANIESAVKTFVDSYNSLIDQIDVQLTMKPSSSDPTIGMLFGDNDLTDLLSNLRNTMYTPLSGLTGFTSLSDIGVSTGAASGSANFSQTAVDGKLTIDSTALENAIKTNSSGVKQLLQGWSQSFATVANAVGGPGGTIDTRIQGDTSEIGDLRDQIDNLNAIVAQRQTTLQAQFANLEALLSQSQSQSNWLASQINSLSSF
jgi:flagellar hook-associated protein 2